jgi:hypothetical protein
MLYKLKMKMVAFMASKFIFAALLSFIATASFSQSASTQIEGMTERLLTLSGQYQKAGRSEQPRLLQELVAVAAERQKKLASLIAMNPGEVLRFAIASDQRARMPVQVQDHIEAWVEIEGMVEVLSQDPGGYLYFLQAAEERFSLHFASSKSPGLITGSRIRVKGVRVGKALAL